VPKKLRLLAWIVGEGVPGIVIAIAARKSNNTNFHGEKFYFSKCVSRWRDLSSSRGPGQDFTCQDDVEARPIASDLLQRQLARYSRRTRRRLPRGRTLC